MKTFKGEFEDERQLNFTERLLTSRLAKTEWMLESIDPYILSKGIMRDDCAFRFVRGAHVLIVVIPPKGQRRIKNFRFKFYDSSKNEGEVEHLIGFEVRKDFSALLKELEAF